MNNIKELDIAKGFLILMVVVGHAGIENTRIIYWFHMPAFFMISGFLMNKKKVGSKNSGQYIFRKILKLFVPYVSFLLLLGVLSTYFNLGKMNILSWEFFLKALIGGKLLFGQFGAFWFITCLMTTIFLYFLIEKFVRSVYFKILIVLVAFLLGHLESYFIQNGANIVIPGNADTAFVTLSYFYVGVWFRSFIIKKPYFLQGNQKIIMAILCISIISLFVLSSYLFDNNIDLKYQKYANPFASFIVPILFSVLIFSLCHFLKKIKFSAFFSLLGKQSLIVMYLHLIFKSILVKYNAYNPYLFIAVGSIFPLLIFFLLQKNKYSRSIFLGNLDFSDSFFVFPKTSMASGEFPGSSTVSIKEKEEKLS